MTNINEIYKCSICGNIVEVTNGSAGQLVCCGKPMTLLEGNTEDASMEKHVPVITKIVGGWMVKIGQDEHPMTPEHYIEWIELIAGNKLCRKRLKPGDKPEAKFRFNCGNICRYNEPVSARALCNLHGLWKNEQM